MASPDLPGSNRSESSSSSGSSSSGNSSGQSSEGNEIITNEQNSTRDQNHTRSVSPVPTIDTLMSVDPPHEHEGDITGIQPDTAPLPRSQQRLNQPKRLKDKVRNRPNGPHASREDEAREPQSPQSSNPPLRGIRPRNEETAPPSSHSKAGQLAEQEDMPDNVENDEDNVDSVRTQSHQRDSSCRQRPKNIAGCSQVVAPGDDDNGDSSSSNSDSDNDDNDKGPDPPDSGEETDENDGDFPDENLPNTPSPVSYEHDDDDGNIERLREEIRRLLECQRADELCKQAYRDRIEQNLSQIAALKKERRTLLETINQLRGQREPLTPWKESLVDSLDSQNELSYETVYKSCCQQENMSIVKENVHPDIVLVERLSAGDKAQLNKYRNDMKPNGWEETETTFDFFKLPTEALKRVFEHLFYKGDLIHCLSRLDPWKRPIKPKNKDHPELWLKCSQLPHRFHIGPQNCCVRKALKPRWILQPFLVCRRFYFLSAHAFYGSNTFAFSSLGEFGRFMNGSGRSRIERIRNVEIFWHGNLMRPADPTKLPSSNPNRPQRFKVSDRTLPLKQLGNMRKLETAALFINTTDHSRIRRKYEVGTRKQLLGHDFSKIKRGDKVHKRDCFFHAASHSVTHPNTRISRNLRAVHGMDYIYNLRAMRWVRLYEAYSPKQRKAGVNGYRENIRDWSFVEDVNNVCTQPKNALFHWSSQLENLTPLRGAEKYEPTEEDMAIVRHFYQDQPLVGPARPRRRQAPPCHGGNDNPDENDSSHESSDDSSDDDGGIGGNLQPSSGGPAPRSGPAAVFRTQPNHSNSSTSSHPQARSRPSGTASTNNAGSDSDGDTTQGSELDNEETRRARRVRTKRFLCKAGTFTIDTNGRNRDSDDESEESDPLPSKRKTPGPAPKSTMMDSALDLEEELFVAQDGSEGDSPPPNGNKRSCLGGPTAPGNTGDAGGDEPSPRKKSHSPGKDGNNKRDLGGAMSDSDADDESDDNPSPRKKPRN